MDTQAIKTFIQVANLGSFTKAAEELRYAQSTVTMQIQRLEEELGFPLFERIGRKSCLTPGGQNFLPKATQILRLLQEASAVTEIASHPHKLIPIIFVTVTVLAFNFLGDGLRDAFDPKLKH